MGQKDMAEKLLADYNDVLLISLMFYYLTAGMR